MFSSYCQKYFLWGGYGVHLGFKCRSRGVHFSRFSVNRNLQISVYVEKCTVRYWPLPPRCG